MAGLSFCYQLVKGRGRYLCQLKLENILANDPNADQMSMYFEGDGQAFTVDKLKLYQSMEQALAESAWDGDRDNWEDSILEEDWRPLTSDRYQCLGRSCEHVNQCAFFSARNQLEESQVLVANHDLVLADLALGGGAILPPVEDSIYVFDEAHHLGDKARKHFSTRFRLGSSLTALEQQAELTPRMREELSHLSGMAQSIAEIDDLSEQLKQRLSPIKSVITGIFNDGIEEDAKHSWRSNDNHHLQTEYRFKQGLVPERLKEQVVEIHKCFSKLLSRMELLSDKLSPTASEDEDGSQKDRVKDDWFPIVGQWVSRLENGERLWRNYGLANEQAKNHARWIKLHEDSDDYELFSSPILAGDMLYDQLWSKAAGAVLTSATLTALGQFDRLKMRSGLDNETQCMQLPSPFNYPEKAELYIPKNAADPKDAWAHDAYLIESLPSLLESEKGNLVLFSSGRQMDEVFDQMDTEWQKRILVQGSRSKQKLIDRHKARIDESKGSTIFGLASFAEGIDLPGKYCEHVLIAKIPFGVPTEPEEEAFSEWIEARGGNSFRDISLADASMRLVQSVGRLLRSENDEGRVTITDNRLLTKSYGRQLIAALPPMRSVESA